MPRSTIQRLARPRAPWRLDMKTPILALTLIAASILTTPAWAGSALNPEVTDAASDAPGSVDITSAWFSSTATDLVVTIKVADLSQSSPALDNEGALHNTYRVEFVVASTGARYFLEAQIHFVDTETLAGESTLRVGTPVAFNVGTQFAGGRMGSSATSIAGTVSVDAAAGTIKVTTAKGSTFPAGASLTQISVMTYQNGSPYEVDNGLSAFIGGARVQKDGAVGSRAFTVI